jgi:hypothetical protein
VFPPTIFIYFFPPPPLSSSFFLGIGTFSDETENRLTTDYVFFRFCFFFTRSGVIRIVVRRSARQPTEQHYGSDTQQSYA